MSFQWDVRMYNICSCDNCSNDRQFNLYSSTKTLTLNITPTLIQILILNLPQTPNPIITLTLTLCCLRYQRRSTCRRSKCQIPETCNFAFAYQASGKKVQSVCQPNLQRMKLYCTLIFKSHFGVKPFRWLNVHQYSKEIWWKSTSRPWFAK